MNFNYFFESIQATQWVMAFSLVFFLYFVWRMFGKISDARGLYVIMLLGLALRVWWMLATEPLPASDFEVYWQYATAFFNGDLTYEEVSRHPGIPVLFSFMFKLFGGPKLEAVWALNLFLSAVWIGLTYLLVYRLTAARWAGYLGAALVALLPQAITYAALAASEVMAVTFAMTFLWAFLESENQKTFRPWYWVGMGFLLAGTVLIRSSNLMFLGLMPVLALLFRRDNFQVVLKHMLVFLLTAGVAIGSWVYHQKLIAGEAKLFWGAELWISCAIQYDRGGRYTDLKDMAFYNKIEPYWKSPDLKTRIKAYDIIWDESLKVIKADPVRYLSQGRTRLRNIVWTSQTGLRWAEQGSEKMSHWPKKVIKKMANVSNLMWQGVLIAALIGLVMLLAGVLRDTRKRTELAAVITVYSAVWLGFHYLVAVASERYGFQLIPYAVILAAYAVFCVGEFTRKACVNISYKYTLYAQFRPCEIFNSHGSGVVVVCRGEIDQPEKKARFFVGG